MPETPHVTREESEVVVIPEAEVPRSRGELRGVWHQDVFVDVLAVTSPIHLECVRVPAGEFLMGSSLAVDREAAKGELPQHRVTLDEFTIGKVPVTNAQYAAFVRSAKYGAPSYWDQEGFPAGQSDHPVVQVSWRDARAFCAWLSEATGRTFRLPTEAEWEKAARGANGRTYPWGDRWPEAELCNYEMLVGRTTPVGAYPGNASPYGALDMAGNVGEWTSSLYRPYPYRANDGREDLTTDAVRVVRGGAYSLTRWNARCACRLRYAPDRRSGHDGFRVVVSASDFEF
jgi:formylglycine-generating enzyme required for sulfatase activity